MSAFIQGRGDVFGPAGATDGNYAAFDGATGKIIKSVPRTDAMPVGSIIQVKQTSRSDNFSTAANATIPHDNTTPQITEGVDLVIPVLITPAYSNSLVRLTFVAAFTQTTVGSSNAIAALFRNAVANAIGTTYAYITTVGTAGNFYLVVYDSPGAITQQTYNIRAGNGGGNHLFFNGASASPIFNGTMRITLTAEEIKQ